MSEITLSIPDEALVALKVNPEQLGAERRLAAYRGYDLLHDDAASRAGEILLHHRVRLDVHEEALRAGMVTTYEVAQRVWGTGLGVHELRFALGEAISHLVRLDRLGRAREIAPGRWATT